MALVAGRRSIEFRVPAGLEPSNPAHRGAFWYGVFARYDRLDADVNPYRPDSYSSVEKAKLASGFRRAWAAGWRAMDTGIIKVRIRDRYGRRHGAI